MNKLRKTIINIFGSIKRHKIRSLVIALVILGLVFYLRNANKPPQVEKVTVRRSDIKSVIEASGKIKAEEYADLAFAIPGKVVWVGVKKGDYVEPYQTLATMDQREVAKTIRRSLLDYMNTRWDFEQVNDDYNVNGRPINDVPGLDDAAKRIIEKSQFGLDQSVLDYEIATLASEQYYLMAPFAGEVISNGNLVAGEMLGATALATKTIRIVNPSTLYFQANVDEIDYARISEGQSVNILLDSFPETTFLGRVTYIGREGIAKTGGSVQVPIDITFDTASEKFVPELNGDVEIVLETKSDVLVLPKKYVSRENDEYSVNIMKDNKIEKRKIKIGLTGPDSYEITDGLKEGDEVVIEL